MDQSLKDILRQAIPTLIVQAVAATFAVVSAVTLMRYQIDQLSIRVEAVEQQHGDLAKSVNEIGKQIYWLYQIHGGK